MKSASMGLLRDSVLMVAAAQVGNIANLLFQVFMMHRLDDAEYGALAAMLGVVLALSLPMDALRSWVAHVAARLVQGGRMAELSAWLRKAWRTTALFALILAGAFFLGRDGLAGWFGVDRGSLVGWTGCLLAVTLMGPLLYGALQGLQAFGVLSILGQAQALLRLGLGVACVLWIRAGADLALAGHLVAVSLILFAGMGWLRRRLNRPAFSERTDRTPPAGWGYAVRSLIVLAAAGILMNADVVLAKRYLDPSVAGVFARAATVARAIVFLPAPIALALFPRVASSGMLRAGDRRLLQHAVGLVTLLILAAVGVATWALPWIYPLLTGGESDASTLFLARSLLWALSPIGIVILLLNFAMAQHRFSACYPVCAGAAGYLGAVALWHRTPGDIVRALAGFGFLSLLVLVIRLRRVLWQKDGSEFAGRVIESAGNGK